MNLTLNITVCLLGILLAPLAAAGLVLIHQGMGRSRSAAHAMLASLCALGVSAITFVAVGAAWAGYSGGAVHVLHLHGAGFDALGAEPFFATNARAVLLTNPYAALVLCLDLCAVIITAIIPVSAGSDRWRLSAICAASAVTGAVAFPLFAHWAWGGGWLAQLPSLGLPAFVDANGAGAVHALGGLTALAVVILLGPRHGKYSAGMPTALPGHNIVLSIFGCLLVLIGWSGFGAAAAVLFHSAPPLTALPLAINNVLAASAGSLAALLTTRIRYRKPDASLTVNGWTAGLVAVSAGAAEYHPLAAICIAALAGIAVPFLVEALELQLFLDDPGGAISVHAAAGLWGLLAYGIFSPAGLHLLQTISQLFGIAGLLGVIFPLTYVVYRLLNRFVRFRVDADGDRQGMDIRELGAGAYPEFVLHADEFIPR